MTDEDKRDEVVGAVYDGLPPEAPPSGIDSAVLAAAHDSVAPPRRRNWAVPASLAAVLVLAVAVTLRMETERPDVRTMEEPARPIQPIPSKELSQPGQPNQRSTPSAPSASGEPLQQSPAVEPLKPPVQVPSDTKATAPAAPSTPVTAAPPMAQKAPVRAQAEQAPTRAQREPLRREDRARLEATTSTEDSAAGQEAAAKPSPESGASRQSEPVKGLAKPAAPVPPPLATPATPPATATPAAPPGAPAATASAGAQERSPARAEQAPAAARSAGMDAGLSRNIELAPDAWLERIAAMRMAGRDIEAEVNIAEFRRHYPKFNIPPEMRDRIARQK